ncbi:MAG: hypothetical protein RIQ93_281 [Verrucomicrobiota bacterium]|jgi:hypothetical protein
MTPVLIAVRHLWRGVTLAGFVLAVLPAGSIVAAETSSPPARPLRVCLVSGANESKDYRSDETLRGLADHLQKEYQMVCEVLVANPQGTGFNNVEHLLEADAAVLFIRRKNLGAHNLNVFRKFVASDKGVIALRSTSYGWENWAEFDTEVLGAKYPRDGSGNFGNVERLLFKPHAIWEGVVNPTKVGVALTTRRDIFRYNDFAPDVSVLLEAETEKGTMPVAWTRQRGLSRVFYVGLGYAEEVELPGYRRMVRNALYWVTNTKPPTPKAPQKGEDG